MPSSARRRAISPGSPAGEIGEKILKASEQYSYSVDPVRDGTLGRQDMERVTTVSYSDVQTLPDLSCYVTLPGPYPAVKMALKYQKAASKGGTGIHSAHHRQENGGTPECRAGCCT